MTIPKAAQLVLQAAVLAQGGDVLLLDMGEPVRIKDLAEQMVRLSGLSLRTPTYPSGDIEIVCTGLRPQSSSPRSMPWRRPLPARWWKLLSECWHAWCPNGKGGGVPLPPRPRRHLQRVRSRKALPGRLAGTATAAARRQRPWLGETSLTFLVHHTMNPEKMLGYSDIIRSIVRRDCR